MKTIAIIEDDIYIGNMLEELLQMHGYRTLRAYYSDYKIDGNTGNQRKQ